MTKPKSNSSPQSSKNVEKWLDWVVDNDYRLRKDRGELPTFKQPELSEQVSEALRLLNYRMPLKSARKAMRERFGPKAKKYREKDKTHPRSNLSGTEASEKQDGETSG